MFDNETFSYSGTYYSVTDARVVPHHRSDASR
jgi:hypothetical protein